MRKTHFISLIPNLLNEAGHDFIYHRCLEKICDQLGLPYHALTSCSSAISLPKRWVSFFRGRKGRFLAFSRAFVSMAKGEKRIFFIESFSSFDLICFALSSLLFSRRSDSVWILFRYGKSQLYGRGAIHIFLSKCLRRRLGNQFVALTDSELVRTSFEPHLKLDLMPVPHTESFRPLFKEKKGIVLWWPGAPRAAKGLQEIQNLCKRTAPIECELVLAQSALLPNQPGIQIKRVADVLPREEYIRQMQEADFILLPYDSKMYRMGTSGILIESVIAGKIPVVKEGGWLSYELRRFSLESLIVDWSRKDLFELLIGFHKDERIRILLDKMRAEYLQFHSLQSYQQKVEKLLNR